MCDLSTPQLQRLYSQEWNNREFNGPCIGTAASPKDDQPCPDSTWCCYQDECVPR
jgi:hypothetical protein